MSSKVKVAVVLRNTLSDRYQVFCVGTDKLPRASSFPYVLSIGDVVCPVKEIAPSLLCRKSVCFVVWDRKEVYNPWVVELLCVLCGTNTFSQRRTNNLLSWKRWVVVTGIQWIMKYYLIASFWNKNMFDKK